MQGRHRHRVLFRISLLWQDVITHTTLQHGWSILHEHFLAVPVQCQATLFSKNHCRTL